MRRSLKAAFSDTRTYTTKHGTVATMNTAAIGKKPALPAPPPQDDEPPLFPDVAPPPPLSLSPAHESKAGAENRAMDPRAVWVWGRLLDFKRDGILTADPAAIEAEMLNHMRDTVRELGPKVIDWLKRLVTVKERPQ